MTILGAGLAPFGLAPAGVGVLPVASSPLNGVLPDVVTSLPQTGRYINFRTKDYALTSDGRIVGMGTTQQMVLLALTTLFGSSADPQLGQTYTQIQEKGASYQAAVTNAVQQALADLIKRGFVVLNAVIVQESPAAPDAAQIQVMWTDVTTGTQQTNSFGP